MNLECAGLRLIEKEKKYIPDRKNHSLGKMLREYVFYLPMRKNNGTLSAVMIHYIYKLPIHLHFTPAIVQYLQTIERGRKTVRLTILPPMIAEQLRPPD